LVFGVHPAGATAVGGSTVRDGAAGVVRTGAACACVGGAATRAGAVAATATAVRAGADGGGAVTVAAVDGAVAGGALMGGELGATVAVEAAEELAPGDAVPHPAEAPIRINAKSAPTTMSARLKDMGTQ
jgi:hypothetical protein